MMSARDQDNQRGRKADDLLAEAETLAEQFKTTHDQSLGPRIQGLRQAAHERQNIIGNPQGRELKARTKACPYCGESILAVARKCKHCGSMVDGSEPAEKVMVTAVDPFAQLHAPIAGKKKGKITIIGYLGIALGFLFMVVACVLPGLNTDDAVGLFALGVGLPVACFLWARKGR